MLVPFSWLKEYVDIDITPQELEKKLFDCGFEVEELREVGADIKNVVVGLVETCEAIPDTHLHVTTVNAGQYGTFQVCCGADNVCAGGKFPLALVGAQVEEDSLFRPQQREGFSLSGEQALQVERGGEEGVGHSQVEIVEPDAENIILSPICAHVMGARSFVLDPTREIMIRTDKSR